MYVPYLCADVQHVNVCRQLFKVPFFDFITHVLLLGPTVFSRLRALCAAEIS